MRRRTARPELGRFVLAFALAVALAASSTADAYAQTLPEGVTREASVEGITEYVLDNGLRVILFPDQAQQQITVNMTVMVGSRHEGYGETGMAHYLEHMVFKGSPKHPDIPQEFSDRGAFWNGTTWFDRTNYFETFPASEENLAWALDLEADRLVNSFVAEEDLRSEMTVVRNEWEAGENNPFGVLMKRTMSTAFQWHNYGNSTIGARADIEYVPVERLREFYRKYYQPDNAMLVVAGRFDEGRALELIVEKFGAIPRPEREGANKLYETYTAEPTQDGERSITLRRVGDTQYAMAIYHVPAGSHSDFAAVDVLAHALGNEPSGRLYKGLVEAGLAASTGAFGWQLREPGTLMAFAEVRMTGDLEAANTTMLDVIESVVDEPVTEEEVERAKNDLLTSIDLAFRRSQSIALQLSEWGSMGDWRLFFLHRDRLKEVTPEDIRRVAAAYLMPSNRTVGLFMPVEDKPLRAEIPAAPNVGELVASYTGGEAVEEGEAFDPTPANVEARTSRFELPAGFKYAFLPKENRGNTVVASFRLIIGNEEALMGQATAGDMAGDMLMRGTVNRTRQELEDELNRLGARAGVGGSVSSVSGSIQTTRERLADVLRLIGEVLHEPAFDEREWNLLKEERLAQIESQMSEPGPRASIEFSRRMSPFPEDHPRYTPTLEERKTRLEAVTLAEARAFYERFYEAAEGGSMAVVGDFDPEEIRPIIEEVFGDWSSEVEFARIAEPYRPVEAETVEIETPDKTNSVFLAGYPFEMGDEHPDYPAMELGNYMLGGAPLASRLANRVRQQEGLSYGIGSGFSAHPVDNRGVFQVFAIQAPENVGKVETAIMEEIERALADGFTQEEFDKAKAGWLEQQQLLRAQDPSLAGMLSTGLYFGRTLEWDSALERAVRALTLEQVNAAVRRWIDPAKLLIIKAGDFEGTKVTS